MPTRINDSYRTLEKPSEGLFRDRNSRFISFAHPVSSLAEINDLLASVRKKYHDARHHCFAFRIDPENEQFRINDDGEPSGTAGKPIYNQILAHDLHNVLVVVVRYFGGTLLGTGGLINAYRSAANDSLNKAVIVTRFIENTFDLKFPYEKLNAVLTILRDENATITDHRYDTECRITVAVPKNSSDRFIEKLTSSGYILIKQIQSD